MGGRTERCSSLDNIAGDTGQPALPCVDTGEPQRAEGATSNTPPPACRWSPAYGTREALSGRQRSMGSRERGERSPARPRPWKSGGRGGVVGARERRGHERKEG